MYKSVHTGQKIPAKKFKLVTSWCKEVLFVHFSATSSSGQSLFLYFIVYICCIYVLSELEIYQQNKLLIAFWNKVTKSISWCNLDKLHIKKDNVYLSILRHKK